MPLARRLLVPALATAAIVLQAQVHLAIGVPGHRGLIWLTALALVALQSGRGWTIGTGAVAAALTLAIGTGNSGPLGVVPYLLAAFLLEVVAAARITQRHPAWIIPAAAGIHLVALLPALVKSLTVGVRMAAFASGMLVPILLHVVFGALAGTLAWLDHRALLARRIDA